MNRAFSLLPPEGVKQGICRTTLGYALFGIINFVFSTAVALACIYAKLPFVDEKWFSLALSLASMYLVAFPILFFIIRRAPSVTVKKTKISLLDFLLLIPVIYTVTVSGGLIGTLVNELLNLLPFVKAVDAVQEIMSGGNLWLLFVVTVVIAPVMEELVFRKLLIPRLLPIGEKTAVLLSGLFFGLFHGNFSQFFYAFGIGVLFGVIFVRTGRVIYTIILHMTVNFFSGIVPSLITSDLTEFLQNPTGIIFSDLTATQQIQFFLLAGYSITQYLLALFGVWVLVLMRKTVKSALLPSPYSAEISFRIAWLNAGTVLMILYCLSQFVLNLISL